ncbi:hypothetical protein [Pseudoalteromonas pernae]|uniref:hypothetical protein n=1 Tax=Pseudoalteromonas pernae TaxID=3118054 RepID=UPI003242931B
MKEKLLPLNALFSASNKEWNSELRQRLYATSWAFVYFMMEKQERRQELARLIKAEQNNVCDILDVKHLANEISFSAQEYQSEFTAWSKLTLQVQAI